MASKNDEALTLLAIALRSVALHLKRERDMHAQDCAERVLAKIEQAERILAGGSK